jgi:hypothetical protein
VFTLAGTVKEYAPFVLWVHWGETSACGSAAASAGASRLPWLNAGGVDVAACALLAAATAPTASAVTTRDR